MRDPITFGKDIASLIRRYTARALNPLEARVEMLERRFADLEQRKSVDWFPYQGVWDVDAGYKRGAFVTDHGSLWVALTDTTGRPGHCDDWQLAVKRGRAA